jgi:hypothetical protein
VRAPSTTSFTASAAVVESDIDDVANDRPAESDAPVEGRPARSGGEHHPELLENQVV